MIALSYPNTSDDQYYLVWKNIAFGFYTPDGLYKPELETFDSSLEAIVESKGIYGENNVEHDKLMGSFEYHPIVNDCEFIPSLDYPHRMKIPVKSYLGTPSWKTVNFGLALLFGATYGRAWSVYNHPLHYAFHRDDNNNWVFYELQASKDDVYTITSYSRTTIDKITKVSGDTHSITSTKSYYSLGAGVQTTTDWSKPQSYDLITGMSFTKTLYTITSSSYGYLYKVDPTLPSTPTDPKTRIDSLIQSLFYEESPLVEKDYGELAHEATQKVFTNQVNMIAFVRDLTHIKDLIPKLKNLHRVKTWANNYLAVEYGVLPTVRDLEDIWAAMNSVKPYVDKLGYQTYGSGYSDDVETENRSWHLTQRIKIAIGEEDEAMAKLCNQIDHMGAFPTLENVWDLISYSFVVDWFVDIGGFLERADTNLRLERLNIKYVTMSRKIILWATSSDLQTSPFIGTVNWSHYHRWVSDTCPTPPLSFRLQERDFDHWLESAALILSR